RQLKVARHILGKMRNRMRSLLPARKRANGAGIVGSAQDESVTVVLRRVTPPGHTMPFVSSWLGLERAEVEAEQLFVMPQITEHEDCFAIARPGRVFDRVRELRSQALRLPARSRHDKEAAVVIRIEPIVGLRHEENLAIIGR